VGTLNTLGDEKKGFPTSLGSLEKKCRIREKIQQTEKSRNESTEVALFKGGWKGYCLFDGTYGKGKRGRVKKFKKHAFEVKGHRI